MIEAKSVGLSLGLGPVMAMAVVALAPEGVVESERPTTTGIAATPWLGGG